MLIDDRFGHLIHSQPQVKEAFDVVGQWFQEVTKTFTKEISSAMDLGLKGQVGGDLDAEIGVGGLKLKTELGKLSAAISVIRRSEGRERTEIRETLERYNNQLVQNLNSLLLSLIH